MPKTAYVSALELWASNWFPREKLSVPQLVTLVRASRTLHRWAELECGNSNDHASWHIERDEVTEKPFLVTLPYRQGVAGSRRLIPDRERGALRRIATIAASAGLHWYHQGDCRGLALYVATEPLTDQNYSSRGIAIG